MLKPLRYLVFTFCCLAIGILAFQPAEARSLSVEPMFFEVTSGQSAGVKLSNPGDTETTVEIYVSERIVDENGNQTLREADDDFIIFPPQAVIDPQGVQVIRFQPIVQDTKSRSYYITARQVPVDLNEETAGTSMKVNVIFAFDVAVHVVPRGTKPKPRIISVKNGQMLKTSIEDYEEFSEMPESIREFFTPSLDIEIANDGNKYLYLQDYIYELTGSNPDNVELPDWSKEDIVKYAKVVLVKPGESRTLKLPVPSGLRADELSVELKKRR